MILVLVAAAKNTRSAMGNNFLQSLAWGEFQEQNGNKVFRLKSAQCYIVKSRFAKYLYCPRGPLSTDVQSFNDIVGRIIALAKENGVDFVVLEPVTELDNLEKLGFLRQKKSIQ